MEDPFSVYILCILPSGRGDPSFRRSRAADIPLHNSLMIAEGICRDLITLTLPPCYMFLYCVFIFIHTYDTLNNTTERLICTHIWQPCPLLRSVCQPRITTKKTPGIIFATKTTLCQFPIFVPPLAHAD